MSPLNYLQSFAFPTNLISGLGSYIPTSTNLSNLSESIQNRLVSFIIGKGLGKLVKGFQDGQTERRNELEVKDGKVNLGRLDLDEEAVTALIPKSLPITFTSGFVTSTNLTIPHVLSLTNLWSTTTVGVRVDVDEIFLHFHILPDVKASSSEQSEAADPSDHYDNDDRESDSGDSDILQQSVLQLTQEFLLAQSMASSSSIPTSDGSHLSPADDDDDPFSYSYSEAQGQEYGQHEAPGAFPTTRHTNLDAGTPGQDSEVFEENVSLLAGLVDALLARLEMTVKKVIVRLSLAGENEEERHLELRMDTLKYSMEVDSLTERTTDVKSPLKKFSIQDVSVWMSTSPSRTGPGVKQETGSLESSVSTLRYGTSPASGRRLRRRSSTSTLSAPGLIFNSASPVGLDRLESSANTLPPRDVSETRSESPIPPDSPPEIEIDFLGDVIKTSYVDPDTDEDELADGQGMGDLAMSMAVADLRESQMMPLVNSDPILREGQADNDEENETESTTGESLYESAIGGDEAHSEDYTPFHPLSTAQETISDASLAEDRSPTPVSSHESPALSWVRILFDKDDERALSVQMVQIPKTTESRSTLKLEIDCSHLRIEFAPSQLLDLMAMVNGLGSASASGKGIPSDKITPRTGSRTELLCRWQGLDAILHHSEDSTRIFGLQKTDGAPQNPDSHDRLYIQGVRISRFRKSGKSIVLGSVQSIHLLDFVPLNTHRSKNLGTFQALVSLTSSIGQIDKRYPVTQLDRVPNDVLAEVGEGLLFDNKDDRVSISTKSIDCQLELSTIDRILKLVNRLQVSFNTQGHQRAPESNTSPAPVLAHTLPTIRFTTKSFRLLASTELHDLRRTPENRPSTASSLMLCIKEVVLFARSTAQTEGRLSKSKRTPSNTGTVAMVELQLLSVEALLVPRDRPNQATEAFLKLTGSGNASGISSAALDLKVRVVKGQPAAVTARFDHLSLIVNQATSNCLQYIADDLTRYLDNIDGDDDGCPREDLRMVGSRFFGPAKAEVTWLESAYADRTLLYKLKMDIAVKKAQVEAVETLAEGKRCILALLTEDISVRVKQANSITDVVLSIQSSHASSEDSEGQKDLLVPLVVSNSLSRHSPMVQIHLLSGSQEMSTSKETNLDVILSGGQCRYNFDNSVIEDLLQIFRSPEGVFENMVPSDVTRASIALRDWNWLLLPPGGDTLALMIGSCLLRTMIVDRSDDIGVNISLRDIGLFASNAVAPVDFVASTDVSEFEKAGFATLGRITRTDLRAWKGKVSRKSQLEILRSQVHLKFCSDSLTTIIRILSSLTEIFGQSGPTSPSLSKERDGSGAMSQDLLASLDQTAFSGSSSAPNEIDLLPDNLPSHTGYLEPTSRSSRPKVESASSVGTKFSLRSKQVQSFPLYQDRVTALLRDSSDIIVQNPQSTFSVSNLDIAISLYSGYDWKTTRDKVQKRIRELRAKLQLIRQILATGHTASPEDLQEIRDAKDWLNSSVYVAFPKNVVSLESSSDNMGILADDLEELAAEDEPWETIKNSRPSYSRPNSQRSAKTLERSAQSQVDLSLKGVRFIRKTYDRSLGIISGSTLTVHKVEILDHIRTSTWNKFLSELPAAPHGEIAETDAKMFAANLEHIRLQQSESPEARLKVKISPLRFYVDQDTLGFISNFFSSDDCVSQPSSEDTAPKESSRTSETFFQHVEVLPIRLKLDYKPKRVDLQGLRKGRVMQMINFFHFEGSEMVFRHVTLRGVSGWGTLYTKLNDIWAPDVRANQLSDVLSGITPIRSVVNVGSGVMDLILLPIDQYRKEGKWMRGMKRGAKSLAQATAFEAINLGGRLATGTQVILEKAENVLGGRVNGMITAEALNDGSLDSQEGAHLTSRYAKQPSNLREGLGVAQDRLSTNVRSAAQTILAIPMEVYDDENGQQGSVKPIIRAVPIAVLQTMIGITDASRNTLFGLRNQFQPSVKADLAQKYKSP